MQTSFAVAGALITLSILPLIEAAPPLVLSANGTTVSDSANNVSWLADANLPASNRFGIPVCGFGTTPCINASGSMGYQAAKAWVAAMNAANYLGHTNWQIPATPPTDTGCGFVGPNGASFGFNCAAGAPGSLYYNALGFKAPNTAFPVPDNAAGPFTNFQPYLYWSQTVTPGTAIGYATFSFSNGIQASNTKPNFIYVLPMIPGKIPGTPAAMSKALQVNPGGQTVYDPVSNVTWLTHANLAATNTFGLPLCKAPGSPQICVNPDGAMNWDSASQFVANMNSSNGTGFLGQTNWVLPPMDTNCDLTYNCGGNGNPLPELFYGQLGLTAGTPVVATPNITVGAFRNLQPYLYWSCEAATVKDPCQAVGPSEGFEFSFSFGNGFLGTDAVGNQLYVTAYFVGPAAASVPGPVISEVVNAEGESPAIAPNTWAEIRGVGLSPAGDTRVWQAADFTGNRLPTQLDHVSVTVNGKNAFIYYISPSQINILTPPDAMTGPVQVVVTNNGTAGASFTAQAQPLSPSLFVFNGGPYPAATHANGTLLGLPSLYPGLTTPAKSGEIIVLYANGFGATSTPAVSGSLTQSGMLPALPVIRIGGVKATVEFAGLVSPGEYQFNVVVPDNTPDGDQTLTVTYNGLPIQPGLLTTIKN